MMNDYWNRFAQMGLQSFEKAADVSVVALERWADYISRWSFLPLQWVKEPDSRLPGAAEDGLTNAWSLLGMASRREMKQVMDKLVSLEERMGTLPDPQWTAEFRETLGKDCRSLVEDRIESMGAAIDRLERRLDESDQSDIREAVDAQEAQVTALTAEVGRLGRLVENLSQRLGDSGVQASDRKQDKAKKGKTGSA